MGYLQRCVNDVFAIARERVQVVMEMYYKIISRLSVAESTLTLTLKSTMQPTIMRLCSSGDQSCEIEMWIHVKYLKKQAWASDRWQKSNRSRNRRYPPVTIRICKEPRHQRYVMPSCKDPVNNVTITVIWRAQKY